MFKILYKQIYQTMTNQNNQPHRFSFSFLSFHSGGFGKQAPKHSIGYRTIIIKALNNFFISHTTISPLYFTYPFPFFKFLYITRSETLLKSGGGWTRRKKEFRHFQKFHQGETGKTKANRSRCVGKFF